LRVIDSADDGSAVFRRSQLEGAVALRQLMSASGKSSWDQIDSSIKPLRSRCFAGPDSADGWFADLFYNPSKSIELDPTIADVHTQPTDADGNDVGHVLHVATGMPQLMVISVDNCTGSQAYVGFASTYYEHVTGGYERLTDSEWAGLLQSGPQPRPAWLPDEFLP
jgi:hypothetical protein